MDLEGILSITGKQGLFKLVGRTNNGIIVESLDNGKRFPVQSTSKVSALKDISIYGHSEDIPLEQIYEKLYENESGGPSLSDKDDVDDLRGKLMEVFPEYDEDRVYASDLKKLFKWYNALQAEGFFEQSDDEGEEKSEDTEKKDSDEQKEEDQKE